MANKWRLRLNYTEIILLLTYTAMLLKQCIARGVKTKNKLSRFLSGFFIFTFQFFFIDRSIHFKGKKATTCDFYALFTKCDSAYLVIVLLVYFLCPSSLHLVRFNWAHKNELETKITFNLRSPSTLKIDFDTTLYLEHIVAMLTDACAWLFSFSINSIFFRSEWNAHELWLWCNLKWIGAWKYPSVVYDINILETNFFSI